MNTNTKHRMVGTTDDVTTCERCGKAEMRGTVILEMLDADGNSEGVTYYGSTCAARALADRGIRTTAAKVRDAAAAAERQRAWAREHAEQMLSFYAIPATGDLDDETFFATARRFQQHNPSISGLRPMFECARLLRDAIPRWRDAVAGVAA